MKNYDVIIIGSGPAGIITGVTLRKLHPEKKVLMITKSGKGLVPCGIPYIFHKLKSVEENKMGPKPFVDAGGELLVDPVTGVKTTEKKVIVESGEEYTFDKLVFATGSVPVVPSSLPGHDLENVFYIKKDYEYISRLFDKIQNLKNIVIVGGGFIGAEVAEQLAANEGKVVTLIESEANCFSKAFSPELSAIATEQVKMTGVNVKTSTMVKEIKGKDGKCEKVITSSGDAIAADAVILSIGYKPETILAKEAGLALNKMGAIIVDNYERTSIDDVCAVGDCSQTIGFLTGRQDYIMLASTATAEARVLGYNLFGIRIKKCFSGTLGVFSTKIGDLTMAAAGVNDNNGKEANVNFMTAKFSDTDRHPATLPDTSSLTLKLYFSPTDGSILGGEVWGGCSAGEIINIIGLAIQKNVTVFELVSYQFGTHPLITTAPTKPLIVKAAEAAIQMMN